LLHDELAILRIPLQHLLIRFAAVLAKADCAARATATANAQADSARTIATPHAQSLCGHILSVQPVCEGCEARAALSCGCLLHDELAILRIPLQHLLVRFAAVLAEADAAQTTPTANARSLCGHTLRAKPICEGYEARAAISCGCLLHDELAIVRIPLQHLLVRGAAVLAEADCAILVRTDTVLAETRPR